MEQINRPTDQPTDLLTDIRGHREVNTSNNAFPNKSELYY